MSGEGMKHQKSFVEWCNQDFDNLRMTSRESRGKETPILDLVTEKVDVIFKNQGLKDWNSLNIQRTLLRSM